MPLGFFRSVLSPEQRAIALIGLVPIGGLFLAGAGATTRVGLLRAPGRPEGYRT